MTCIPENLNIARAPLPASYVAAKDLLRLCARRFSPEAYAAACIALKNCAEIDETEHWPIEDALRSNARMADDESLRRLVRRVERSRDAWAATATAKEEAAPPA